MENNELKSRIEQLGIVPSEAMINKVLELHSRTVSNSTIRKAWRALDQQRKEEEKRAREAAKAARTPPAPAVAA